MANVYNDCFFEYSISLLRVYLSILYTHFRWRALKLFIIIKCNKDNQVCDTYHDNYKVLECFLFDFTLEVNLFFQL